MKRCLSLLVFLYSTTSVVAQKEASIWYFGRNAGIDFNSGSPVTLTNGALNTSEGAATTCDKNGNLLFYTDGQKVWDRTHAQMPNGTGLTGHPSATSSGVIVPNPGYPGRFYIFTVGSHDLSGLNGIPFSWSEVDMSLNGGLGDVVTATKNTLLFTNSTEKIAAIKHANGVYIWVVGEDMNGVYRSYLVDCNGIRSPVSSTVGHSTLASGTGYLKVSPDGRWLASAQWNLGYFLYNFNNVTGVVSNMQLLGGTGSFTYGLSFSPDNSLLYGIDISVGQISQWDMLAGSPSAIAASLLSVGSAPGTGVYRGGALQEAPDGKLYFVQYMQTFLGVINNPNVRGVGCSVQTNAVNLQSRQAVLGLPTFIQSNKDTPVITSSRHCLGDTTLFSVSGNKDYLDSLRWHFGDPASGGANSSVDTAPGHRFSSPGLYNVRLVRYTGCISDTVNATVQIYVAPLVSLGPDTSLCGDTITIGSPGTTGSPSWLWSTGDTGPQIRVSQTGVYWLQATENGCTGVDTISVDITASLSLDLGNDFNICDRDTPIILRAPQPPGTHYLWSNGLSDTTMTVTRTGVYWLQIDRSGCSGSDTIRIGVIPTPSIYIGADSIICSQIPLKTGYELPGAIYRWSTGATSPYIEVNTSGTYVLEVDKDGCIVYDTISVTAMPPPVVDLGADADICPTQKMSLDAGSGTGWTYKWNTGEATATIEVYEAGQYTVHVTDAYHCTVSDTILLSPYPLPEIALPADTTVCEETPLLLVPRHVNADSLLWSDGSVGDVLSIKYGGTYLVTAINKCGQRSDSIVVGQIFCDIWVPNAFTPNGDGANDLFRVLGNIGRLEQFGFSIYDRWGLRLFHTADRSQGWDGKYQGTPSPLGTYVYMLEYRIAGKPYLLKGNFHLIR
jgi:gliding motility-associated-like protein